jgi:hypothetical protein
LEAQFQADGLHSLTADDMDGAYCLDYYIGTDSAGKTILRCVYTTRRLLATGPDEGTMIHFDFTYKTNDLGVPVCFCGPTDSDKVFHLVLAGWSYSETEEDCQFFYEAYRKGRRELNPAYSMADAAAAISNGASAVYTAIENTTCFVHCYQVNN